MTEPLVIYHGNCYDGFTAAWIAHSYFDGEVELFPAKYGEPVPYLIEDRDVYILDFCYSREQMEQEVLFNAKTVVVIDHHKTAMEACGDLRCCSFDMDRSGAGMAWDYFFQTNRPSWVDRVEDRDLWRFRYDDTADVHAYIASLPMTIENWDAINGMPIELIADKGRAIRRYIETYIEKASVEAREFMFNGDLVVAVNVPYQNASELASYLLKHNPESSYSISYFQRADGRWQYSLRSRSDFDVSEVAKKYGGGGHAQAAGFETTKLIKELQ